jgi:hypothetical protein
MEGPSNRNIQQLYGRGSHFGPGFSALIDWLTGHDVTTLPAVVHLNVCLAVANTILFFFISCSVLASWWAGAVFGLAYAGNLNTLHAAFSETPAMLWTTIFLLACVTAAVVGDRAHAPRWLRGAALVLLATLVWLAWALRAELLVVGGPALVAALAHALDREPAVRRLTDSGARALHALVAARRWIFVLVAAGFATLEFVEWPADRIGWMAAGLRPLNLSFLMMPWSLGVFLPFGIIVLFVLGTVHAVRHWFSFFVLPVSTLVLFKIYASASHGVFFERFRYLTYLTPVAMFLALFGFRELADWARRWEWPWWWKRVAVLLLVMTVTFWQRTVPWEIFRRRQELAGLSQTSFLLAWNQQTEVRYLLDLVARHPQCVFVAKTTQTTWVADRRTGSQWALFGHPLARYREIDGSGGTLEEVGAHAALEARCVLYYRSLDCDLLAFEGCGPEVEGRVPLEERVFENLPYSDIAEYGAHRPEIRLATYPIVDP